MHRAACGDEGILYSYIIPGNQSKQVPKHTTRLPANLAIVVGCGIIISNCPWGLVGGRLALAGIIYRHFVGLFALGTKEHSKLMILISVLGHHQQLRTAHMASTSGPCWWLVVGGWA